jgi:PAS domain S-box-containing protein
VNNAFTKMTGYSAEEVIGKNPRLLQGPDTDYEELGKLGEKLRRWEPAETTVLNYTKTGKPFWVSFTVDPVADEKGWFTHWISIQRDVTEQKKQEAEKELRSKISQSFNSEEELIPAANRLCQNLFDFGKFDLIELWSLNLEQTQIKLMGHCIHNPEFYEIEPTEISFQKNEGLPGKVWQYGELLKWDKSDINNYFYRKKGALRLGLKAIFGIPLTFKDDLVGVLLIGTCRESDYLDQHRSVLSGLGRFIGSEINRKKLENDLLHLYQAIPDILCIADFNGRFLKMNPAGCELLGYEEKEILFHSFDEFVHPEDRDVSTNEVKKLEQGKTTFQFENRYITKEGKIIWLNWSCHSSIHEGLIYASAKNITQEVQLMELNVQAGLLAKIGSWEVNLERNSVFWSKMVHQLHETDPDTFIPDLESGINFYRADFRDLVRSSIENCIKTGEDFDFEAVILTEKLKERWVRAIGRAEMITGICNRIHGSFQDISDRKESEISLQASLKSLEDYKFALDQSAIITITDTKGVITSVNDQFCKISKYSKEELIGKTHKIINSGYHPRSFFVELWKTIAQGKVFRGEVKNRAKDGSFYWVDTIIVPFLDENKKPIQYLAIRIDITAKKLANEKIIEVLEEKNQILESIGDAFFAIDKNWTVTYWNKQAEIILGKLKEEIISKNFWSKFPDTIHSEFYVQFHSAMETGQTINFEANYPTIEKWIEVKIYPSDTGLSIYLTDITLRKEADLRLVSANHEKTRILERITEAFVSLDINWCYTYMNKQAGEIFNRDPKNMIGKHIWTEFPEGLNQPFHHAYEKAMATQEYIFLEEHYKPYGRWFENHIYPSSDGISIFFRDVTERKRNEEKLKMANERFEKVTEATNDAIWDWDIVNDSFYRSQNILKFFGKGTPTVLESKDFWTDSFHPDDLKAIKESISKALQNDQTQRWEMEYRILNEKENTIYVIDRGLILRDDSGKAIRVIGAMTDITERKRSELELLAINEILETQTKELERSNKELEQFAFITSHDLQEPLRMISSFMDLLRKKYSDRLDEKGLQYIHFSIDGAKRMKQIILDLLLYSRANKPSEQLEEVDLNEIAVEYTQLRRKLISEKKAIITFDSLPVLQTYRAPFTQIIHSLLDNALKYSKDNLPPRIEFHAKEKETEWEFAVKDNGIGIDKMFYDKIFLIFQRLYNRNLHDGSGIGLSVAKRSVEYLGGQIWLDSTVGEGTTFYFTIAKKK